MLRRIQRKTEGAAFIVLQRQEEGRLLLNEGGGGLRLVSPIL